jgi:hypothetical protein
MVATSAVGTVVALLGLLAVPLVPVVALWVSLRIGGVR